MGGGGGGAAAVALAAAGKQSIFSVCPNLHSFKMLASVLWRRTSICGYWFAVSGDVLTNLLALQH